MIKRVGDNHHYDFVKGRLLGNLESPTRPTHTRVKPIAYEVCSSWYRQGDSCIQTSDEVVYRQREVETEEMQSDEDRIMMLAN